MCDKSTTLSRKIQLLRPKKDILDIPANHLTQRFHFYPTHPGCLTQDIFNIKQAVIRFQKQAFIGDYPYCFIGVIFSKRKIKPFLQQLYSLLRFSTKAMPYPRLLRARFFFTPSSSSIAFTQWIINGKPSFSDNFTCSLNTAN